MNDLVLYDGRHSLASALRSLATMVETDGTSIISATNRRTIERINSCLHKQALENAEAAKMDEAFGPVIK